MQLLPRLQRWRTTPTIGAALKPSPLLIGLEDSVLFNTPSPVNEADHRNFLTPVSEPVWTPTPMGMGADVTGGSSFQIPWRENIAAGDLTLRVVHRPRSWDAGGFTALVDKGDGSLRELSVFFDASGNLSFLAIGASGQPGVPTAADEGMAVGKIWDFVITRTGTTCATFVNGVPTTSSTSASTSTLSDFAPMSIGGNPSTGGAAYDGQYFLVQTWTRALSPSDVWLLSNPSATWDLFRLPASRMFFDFGSAAPRYLLVHN